MKKRKRFDNWSFNFTKAAERTEGRLIEEGIGGSGWT